jgi:hypothetical protein
VTEEESDGRRLLIKKPRQMADERHAVGADRAEHGEAVPLAEVVRVRRSVCAKAAGTYTVTLRCPVSQVR